MIPKTIHYCWFGGSPLPIKIQKYIDSWKKYCPDYEIKEWNETNFNINCNKYVKQAYESKKYAFVSDYVRLYALYNYGGIYMDTDVEVLKNIDDFLNDKAVFGFETKETVSTGIIACIKNNQFLKLLLSHYEDLSFIKDDGNFDLTTNVEIITKYFERKGLILNNKLQCIDGIKVYPKEYFSPKDHITGKINVTKETYIIHHFSGSWLSKKDKMKKLVIRIIGDHTTKKIVQLKKIILK